MSLRRVLSPENIQLVQRLNFALVFAVVASSVRLLFLHSAAGMCLLPASKTRTVNKICLKARHREFIRCMLTSIIRFVLSLLGGVSGTLSCSFWLVCRLSRDLPSARQAVLGLICNWFRHQDGSISKRLPLLHDAT